MEMKKMLNHNKLLVTAVISALFLLTTLCMAVNGMAEEGCAKRISDIETQLQFAESAGNAAKVIGLKKSLANVKQNCTEKSLTEKSEKKTRKLNKKVEETKEDIAEHQEKMKEAMSKGKMDKVHKQQRRIEEKQIKLKHLQDEISGKK